MSIWYKSNWIAACLTSTDFSVFKFTWLTI
jgi:hypothetical protein